MGAADDSYEVAPTSPEDMALLHFTSGTTGTPKGAMHVHEAVVAHHATARHGARSSPWRRVLVHRRSRVGDRDVVRDHRAADARRHLRSWTRPSFEVDRWYGILQDERVTVWYTAPTALRMLMRAGAEVAHEYDLGALRFIASVGEPLNPEVVLWGEEAFGMPVHDNWWQTETGGIMIANYRSMDVRPGSMGRPLPGIEAAVAAPRRGRPAGARAGRDARAGRRSVSRESSCCGRAGRRCSAATSGEEERYASASSAAGI